MIWSSALAAGNLVHFMSADGRAEDLLTCRTFS